MAINPNDPGLKNLPNYDGISTPNTSNSSAPRRIQSVTIDPRRTTRGILREYLARNKDLLEKVDDRIVLLGGEDQIGRLRGLLVNVGGFRNIALASIGK